MAIFSELNHFRLMGKRTENRHTILKAEHLSVAIIRSIHLPQSWIGIQHRFYINDPHILRRCKQNRCLCRSNELNIWEYHSECINQVPLPFRMYMHIGLINQDNTGSICDIRSLIQIQNCHTICDIKHHPHQ